jgi:CheY-like chemotaxis protein
MAAILVVDDDADVLATIAMMLRPSGHGVITASSGVRALELLEAGTGCELLITDVVMPGINGFNLARIARMRRPALPVLFLTGFYELALTLRDPLELYGKLLTKPISRDELQREVEAALGRAGDPS